MVFACVFIKKLELQTYYSIISFRLALLQHFGNMVSISYQLTQSYQLIHIMFPFPEFIFLFFLKIRKIPISFFWPYVSCIAMPQNSTQGFLLHPGTPYHSSDLSPFIFTQRNKLRTDLGFGVFLSPDGGTFLNDHILKYSAYSLTKLMSIALFV